MGMTRRRGRVVVRTSAFALFAFQMIFMVNFLYSLWWGKKADANPWKATTLEWSAPSPPPHGNFREIPRVYRGPHEYSVPGAPEDFTPQWEPEGAEVPTPAAH